MVIFDKIRYKNLLSTGNVFTEIDFLAHKMNLISGKNGGGKSTILDAIVYALYGKPFRKIVKGLLINSINKKELLVELELEVGKNKYKIIRGDKPSVFEIHKNGELIDQAAASKDYQLLIEEDIIKCNYKTFTQIVVLGSATYIPFMELKLDEKRKVIEDVLDIGVFSQIASGPLKEDIDDCKDALQQVNSDMRVTQTKIDMVKEHNEKVKTATKVDTSDIEKEISDIETEIDDLKARKDKFDVILDSYEKKDDKNISKKIQKRAELKTEITFNKKSLAKEIEFLKENTTCPTCKQGISDDFRHSVCEKNEESIAELDEGLKKLVDAIKALEEEYEDIQEYEEKYKSLKTKAERIEYEINMKEKNLILYKKKLEDLRNSANISVDSMDDSEYKETLEKQMQLYNDSVFEREVLAEIAKMTKDDGVKSDIIKRFIPKMNELINNYLIEFDLYVNFTLDENFKASIKSRYRDNFSYDSFSQGEKLRINLSIMLAWKEIAKVKNSINTNLLILDETLDGALDGEGVSDLVKALRNLDGENNNIFVISHRGDTLKDMFDVHIHFEKQKNFSVMSITE